MIITSTESLRRDTERVLLRQSGGYIFGPQVVSIRQFALDLARPDKAVATRWIRKIAVAVALKEARLVHFTRVREAPGTIALFDRAIQALKRGGCTPGRLREWFATRGGPAEYDLLKVFERYESGDFDFIDDGDVFLKATTSLKSGTVPPLLLGVTEIRCVGFRAEDPLISLFQQATPIPVFFAVPDTPVRVDLDTIVLATPIQEARWIARHCADAVAEGYEPEDIGVVVPGDWYREILLKQLAIAEFPVATTGRESHSSAVLRRILHYAHALTSDKRLPFSGWIGKLGALLEKHADATRWVEEYRDSSGGTLAAISFRFLSCLEDFAARAPELEETEIACDFFCELMEDAVWENVPCQPDEGPRIFPFDGPPTAPLKEIIIAHALDGTVPCAPESFQFCSGPEFRDTECTLLRQCLPTVEEQTAQSHRQWEAWRMLATNICIATYPVSGVDGRETVPSSVLPPVEEHLFEVVSRQSSVASPQPLTSGSDAVKITDPAVTAHIGARFRSHRFSVSQLETYARSPFAFFCERVLCLEQDEEETPDISSRQRGIIIHAILDRFVKRHAQTSSVSLEDIVKDIAEDVIREHSDDLKRFHKSLVETLKKDAILLCTRTLKKDLELRSGLSRPLKPVATEWKFGDDTVPPLVIGVAGNAPIELSGTVDRIDADENQFAIYDYKTGRPDNPKTGIDAGSHFQLPIYMSAVEKLLLPNAEAIAGLLIRLGSEQKRTGIAKKIHNATRLGLPAQNRSLVSEDEWQRLRDTAQENLKRTVAMIRAAEFPGDVHECKSWCAWRKVCGRAPKD